MIRIIEKLNSSNVMRTHQTDLLALPLFKQDLGTEAIEANSVLDGVIRSGLCQSKFEGARLCQMFVPYETEFGKGLAALYGLGSRRKFNLNTLVNAIELMLQSAYMLQRNTVTFPMIEPWQFGVSFRQFRDLLRVAQRHTGFPGPVELLIPPNVMRSKHLSSSGSVSQSGASAPSA